jgi:hypothetical protein
MSSQLPQLKLEDLKHLESELEELEKSIFLFLEKNPVFENSLAIFSNGISAALLQTHGGKVGQVTNAGWEILLENAKASCLTHVNFSEGKFVFPIVLDGFFPLVKPLYVCGNIPRNCLNTTHFFQILQEQWQLWETQLLELKKSLLPSKLKREGDSLDKKVS